MSTKKPDQRLLEKHPPADVSPVPGRLATLAGMAMVAGAIPIPFAPDRVVQKLRGAIVHETVARHGLMLSSDARQVLEKTSSDDRIRNMLRKVVHVVSRRVLRRLGPLAPFGAMANIVEVYALGLLLDRYLLKERRLQSPRIQVAEARRIRRAIDKALIRMLDPSLGAAPPRPAPDTNDLRDDFTRKLDQLLLISATLPNYIERKLTSAFDEVIPLLPSPADD